MKSNQIAYRYSKALFNIASSNGSLETELSNLENIMALFQQLPSLKDLLFSTQISKEEKENVLKKAFQGKIDPQLSNFLSYLIKKGRFHLLPIIVKEFFRMVTESSGVIYAKLITAIPMKESLKLQLKEKLQKSYQKKIEIIEKVDPNILGGAILLIDNHMIDFSIKDRLEKLKDNLSRKSGTFVERGVDAT